jgi:hypothetical protein
MSSGSAEEDGILATIDDSEKEIARKERKENFRRITVVIKAMVPCQACNL